VRITLFIEAFEEGLSLATALAFPSCSAADSNPNKLAQTIRLRTRQRAERISPYQLWQLVDDAEAELSQLEIRFEPSKPNASWGGPVELSIPMVTRRAGRHHVIHLPTLDLVVLGESRRKIAEMEARVRAEVRQSLLRRGLGEDLIQLARLFREASFRLETTELNIPSSTPWERYKKKRGTSKKKPLLKEVASRLRRGAMPPAFEVPGTVRRLAEALNQSVLLNAPSGRGKTAVFHELVRSSREIGLGDTKFWSSSGARLVAGQTGFGMWQERCQQLIDDVQGKNVVLHLGNLSELMNVGKSNQNDQGIASFLRPAIARCTLTVVLEATPEQLPALEREDPHFLELLHRIELPEPTPEQTRRILAQTAQAARRGTPAHPGAIERIENLHRRYAAYSANPGRPIRFLSNLLRDCPKPNEADVVQAFSDATGLPRFMLDDDIPLELDQIRAWFQRRVMGQNEAIERVLGLLALVKTRLARPGKPLASLLFIGPTGVGKTEVAKALAACLFGDEDRLTRFDMSEYGDPAAARRLVGGMGSTTGIQGASGEGLLTAKMRQQPFSVLLFDEFEKAHHAVFDLFLQMLGEARLTDQAGRTADFRNAVILLTSNLGASSFKSGGFGFETGAEDANIADRARSHFRDAVQKFLRPEMVNRIDAIIPFDPLPRDVAREVTRKEFERARRRDGFVQRVPTYKAPDPLIDWLTDRGFDLRYGGRPLKRAIERDLLVPLASKFSDLPLETKGAFELRVTLEHEDQPLLIKVEALEVKEQKFGQLKQAIKMMDARRLMHHVWRCNHVSSLRARIDRFLLGKKNLNNEDKAWLHKNLERIERLRAMVHDMESLETELVTAHILRHDEAATNAAKTAKPSESGTWIERHDRIQEQLAVWQLEVFLMDIKKPNRATLAIYGPGFRTLFTRYQRALKEELEIPDLAWEIGSFAPLVEGKAQGRFTKCAGETWQVNWYANDAEYHRAEIQTGIVVRFTGEMVGVYLNDEAGVHVIESEDRQETLRNLVHDISSIEDYEPPESTGRKDKFLHEPKCRTWKLGGMVIMHHPSSTRTKESLKAPALLAFELKTRLESRIKVMFS